MIWDVRNEWPSGAQFTFNCYRNWATLVLRNAEDGSVQFLHRKEGMTQGYHLTMIVYGIGVLPLIRYLWDEHPHITQTWYADDAGAGGGGGVIGAYPGPLQGYAGKGANNGIIPGADQEYLGRGTAECAEVRVVLPWDGDEYYHRDPVPWGFC